MHLHVLVENAGSRPGLRKLIEQRIESALGRFADRIGWVSAYLQQVNGCSDGRSHQCQIEVVLISVSLLEVQAREVDAETAVIHAAERIARRVEAELGRRQASQEHRSKSLQPPIGA